MPKELFTVCKVESLFVAHLPAQLQLRMFFQGLKEPTGGVLRPKTIYKMHHDFGVAN